MLRRVLLGMLFMTLGSGCSIPSDPNGTLQQVRGGQLRVGLVENEPWVVAGNTPAGVEVRLVEELAQELGAQPVWTWGTEQEHMEALHQFELDLVIAGLTDSSPWQEQVGLTNPYFTNRIVVGVPRSMPPIGDPGGVSIAVEQGTVVAALVQQQDAIPVRVEDPSQANGPVAAPAWQLEQWGFAPTDIELHSENHVMAVPPGENAWLMHLDQFLHQRQGRIQQMLQEEAGQ
jgi:polar amino acid transport system substrate-binding protein